MRYYSYHEFLLDIKELSFKLSNEKFDAILFLARGGATMAHFIAMALGVRELHSVNVVAYEDKVKLPEVVVKNLPLLPAGIKEVLVVDEIIDTGESMGKVIIDLAEIYPDKTFRTATLFQRINSSFWADYYIGTSDEWIEFFWEKDLIEEPVFSNEEL